MGTRVPTSQTDGYPSFTTRTWVYNQPPACLSEANFALPQPARSPKSQKKAGSSPPEAQKVQACTSLENTILVLLWDKKATKMITEALSRILKNDWNSILKRKMNEYDFVFLYHYMLHSHFSCSKMAKIYLKLFMLPIQLLTITYYNSYAY